MKRTGRDIFAGERTSRQRAALSAFLIISGCASVTEQRSVRVVSSEVRLIRVNDPLVPLPVSIDLTHVVDEQTLVVRLVATQSCAHRREVRNKRRLIIERHANSTVMGIEKGVVLTCAAMFVSGVVVIAATSTSKKRQTNDCGASPFGCTNPVGTGLLLTGAFVGFYTTPILLIDGFRQLDSWESMPDEIVTGNNVDVKPCGSAPRGNAEIELRSSGPSGKARTDERGEARFPFPPGWRGPVEAFVDGTPVPGFSL